MRPLYLFFRGRLASQQHQSSPSGAVSKQAMWPSNATRAAAAASPAWRSGSKDTIEGEEGDTSANLERGLYPMDHILPQSPLHEKPYFMLGAGR